MFTPPSELLISKVSLEHTAFVLVDGTTVSAGQFRDTVARLSAILQKNENPTVVVHSDDNRIFAIGMFAALHAGKQLIFPHNMQEKMYARLCAMSPIFLTDTEIRAAIKDTDSIPPKLEKINPQTKIAFFSSGSTGTPKLIWKIWENIEDEVVRLNAFLPKFEGKPDPTVIFSVHAYHIYGMLYACLIPLCRSWKIYTELIQAPEEICAKSAGSNPLFFVSSPAFLARWARDTKMLKLDISGDEIAILSSGSILDEPASEAIFNTIGTSAIEVYGSTETGGIAFRQQAQSKLWTIWTDEEISTDAEGALIVKTPLICGDEPFTMGDAVEITNDRKHFKLLGRTNRMIKLEDKRVSLPELEEDLKKSPLVADAYLTLLCGTTRKYLGALVALSEAGREKIFSAGVPAISAELKKFLSASADSTIIPRKWRYCLDLPRNTMGKLTDETVQAYFSDKLQAPLISKCIQTENRVELHVAFPPNAAYFQGHFPTFALLPGVAQLHFVSVFAQKYFGISCKFSKISRLKFKAPLLPGVPANIVLEKSPNRISFMFFSGETVFSQGAFVLG